MRLLINDANILIDIIKIDVIASFLELRFELKTTDLVFAELLPEQQRSLRSKKLQVIETSDEQDMAGIFQLYESNNGVSFEDCSVWYYAKKLNAIMMTGDGSLRKKVKDSGIEVRGMIFLIEEMRKQDLLSNAEAIDKLSLLLSVNPRLPKEEIERRIDHWSKTN